VLTFQIFGNGNSRALFRPLIDETTDFSVSLHLGQIGRCNGLYISKQITIVNVLTNVHGLLLSGVLRLIFDRTERSATCVTPFSELSLIF
jgi:hypothetical protein